MHGWTHSSLPTGIDDAVTYISEILLFAVNNSIDPEDHVKQILIYFTAFSCSEKTVSGLT